MTGWLLLIGTAIIVLLVLKAAFSKRELRRWKRARKVNVCDCREQKAQTIIYHGKKRRIKPVETFEKEGYSKKYLLAKVGILGRTKTFNVDKIRYVKGFPQKEPSMRRLVFLVCFACLATAFLLVCSGVLNVDTQQPHYTQPEQSSLPMEGDKKEHVDEPESPLQEPPENKPEIPEGYGESREAGTTTPKTAPSPYGNPGRPIIAGRDEPQGLTVEGSEFLSSHLRQLLDFRSTETFRFYGFGRGGPHYKWLEEVENAQKARRFSDEQNIAVGYLLQLGLKYLNLRNGESDFTRFAMQEINAAIGDEYKTPKEQAAKKHKDPKWRTWTDATGQFSINARFGGIIAGKVNLLTKDGRKIQLEPEKLSAADQDFLKEKIGK